MHIFIVSFDIFIKKTINRFVDIFYKYFILKFTKDRTLG